MAKIAGRLAPGPFPGVQKRWIVLGALLLAAAVLFLINSSELAPSDGRPFLLAHRGVHQTFPMKGVNNDTCTAVLIYPPAHEYIENTFPSIKAARELGARWIEIDVHPTTDGDFAVFHDWGLDCRTNGSGVTREHAMKDLRTLDVGFGYTADGGRTFPLRGKGVDLMPSLRDVLAEFPSQRFLINFKSADPNEADLMLAYLEATPRADVRRLAFYGASPADRLRELRPDWRIISRSSLKNCATSYVLTGWFGRIGPACRNTMIFVPANYGWIAWGWPNRFLDRMKRANTEVVIFDAIREGARPGSGIDDAEALRNVPRDWGGGILTDRVEVIAPLLQPE